MNGSKSKFVVSVVAGTALALSLVACSGATQPSQSKQPAAMPSMPAGSTMAKLQQKGTMLVGTKYAAPLFGEKNPVTGKMQGFDIEIANELGKRLFGKAGHVEFIEAPTSTREAMIEQGKVDLIVATYTITEERKQKVSFAGPYYNAVLDIVVRADDNSFGKSINGYEALDGRKVCTTQNGTQYNLIAKVAPKAELTGFDDLGKCLTALKQGRVDAVASDTGTSFGMLLNNPGDFQEIPNPKSDEQPYGIGVTKDDSAFCEWINKQLVDMYANGDWAAAYKRSLGVVSNVIPPAPAADAFSHC
ncbi:MAG: glutamate ABC transporter substrate-binding protein [Terrimesophilobacter sp.]